VRKVSRIWGRC